MGFSLLEDGVKVHADLCVLVGICGNLDIVWYGQIGNFANGVIRQKCAVKQVRIIPFGEVRQTLDPNHVGHIVFHNSRCGSRIGTSCQGSTNKP